jgi:hypothetical protein
MARRFAVARDFPVNCMLRHIRRLHAACTLKTAAISSRFDPFADDFDRLYHALALTLLHCIATWQMNKIRIA